MEAGPGIAPKREAGICYSISSKNYEKARINTNSACSTFSGRGCGAKKGCIQEVNGIGHERRTCRSQSCRLKMGGCASRITSRSETGGAGWRSKQEGTIHGAAANAGWLQGSATYAPNR